MTIHIPTPLRTFTNGLDSIPVSADTVSAALEALVVTHPGLRNNLFGTDGKLRSFVNVYLNDEDVRYLTLKEDSPTLPTDELTIIPSIAGGCGSCVRRQATGESRLRELPWSSSQHFHGGL